MNALEFEQITSGAKAPRRVPGIDDLKNREPRTLIYGYDGGRNDFHVYIGTDGLIHVMRYTLRARNSEDGLIFTHFAGESGGRKAPDGFVPAKRAYPESCDAEFCELLFSFGVKIPFTGFTEGADERRREKNGGFAGPVFTEALMGVNLVDELQYDPAYPDVQTDRLSTSAALLEQAAIELGVPFASKGPGQAYVLKTAADVVLARARELMRELAGSPVFDEDSLENLLAELFTAGGAKRLDRIGERRTGSEHLIEVQATSIEFVRRGDFVRYRYGTTASFWCEGVSGTYQGRPFIAARAKNSVVQIRFSHFGDEEKFLAAAKAHYKLGPVIPS